MQGSPVPWYTQLELLRSKQPSAIGVFRSKQYKAVWELGWLSPLARMKGNS